MPAVVEAVVFDMDGVLVDSEELWNAAREQVALENGGRWSERAQRDMMGMSSREWARYMHDELGVRLEPERINEEVVARMERLYRERLPLIDGAREAVERLAQWPLGLASSANRPLIDLVLELAGLSELFAATVSSEEVPRGKPAPDVYLEAARRLGVPPRRAPLWRTPTTGSSPRAPPACGPSPFPTGPSRPARKRSRRPTWCSTRSRS